MEPTKLQSEDFKEQVSKISSSLATEGREMHRDNESIDDFEHLEPESSPVKEFQEQGPQNKEEKPPGEELEVDTDTSHVASGVSQNTSDFSFQPTPKLESTVDDRYNLQFGDEEFRSAASTLFDSAKPLVRGSDFDEYSKLLKEMSLSEQPHDMLGFSTETSVKPETESLISGGEKLDSKFDIGKVSNQKELSQAFMDAEREDIITEGTSSHKDTHSKFPEDVDFIRSETKQTDIPELNVGNLPSKNYPTDDLASSISHEDSQDSDTSLNPLKSDIKHKEKLSDEIGSLKSSLSAQEDDLPSQEEPEPKDEPTPVPVLTHPKLTPSAPEPLKPFVFVPGPSLKPETVAAVEPNEPLPDKPSDKSTSPASPLKAKSAVNDRELEEIKPIQLFHYMGLDAWFKPDRLHPKVVELVYWRDPKKSGIVFGTVLGVLLSLSYFSLISVVAYLSLVLLTATISFRVYKNVLQAVQKTSDGHPFKDILELDLTLPQDKVREVTDIAVAHVNAAALELRRLFLVEDLIDSVKFGVLLWCLTYVGNWFNGMTLIIIAFVALFTLPKVYEHNKVQIDQNLDIVRSKIADITSKVKAAIPIGKKPAAEEEKKDQ